MALPYKDRRSPGSWWDLPKKVFQAPFTQKVRGTLRVGAYLGVLCVVGAGLSARSAYGSMSEQVLVTGRQLAKLADITKDNQRLSINGQNIYMASATTELSMEQVLDRFETICKEDGTVARDLREIRGLMEDPALTAKAKATNYGILREERADDGVIACTVKNPANGKRSFVDGAAKLVEKWDLAEVGFLRYAYVRKLESGRTHVLTAWTEGSFRLDAMTPPEGGGDAPGSDSESVPRPANSIRYLSAGVDGTPHGVRIYEARGTAKQVLADYEEQLPKSGWEQVFVGENAPEARYFSRGGVDVVIVAEQNGDRAAVSMVETKGF